MISHLYFADDLVILVRSLRDSITLLNIVRDWSNACGLPLNESKCVTLKSPNAPKLLPLVNSTTYLGVELSFKDSELIFNRANHNHLISHRISEASKRVQDVETLISSIQCFHDGPYALQICLSNDLRECNDLCSLIKKTTYLDTHITTIFKDFCHIDQSTRVSLRRVVSCLDISAYLAAPSIVRYASNFLTYLSNLPNHSLAKISLNSHSKCAQALIFTKNTLLSHCKKRTPHPEKWVSSQKSVLKWAAPLLTTLPSTCDDNSTNLTNLQKIHLKLLLSRKQYKEAEKIFKPRK